MKGNPEPAKNLLSHREDVSLANPYGPPVREWEQRKVTPTDSKNAVKRSISEGKRWAKKAGYREKVCGGALRSSPARAGGLVLAQLSAARSPGGVLTSSLRNGAPTIAVRA